MGFREGSCPKTRGQNEVLVIEARQEARKYTGAKKTALRRFCCEGKKGNVAWKKKLLFAWFISLQALLHLVAYLIPRTT